MTMLVPENATPRELNLRYAVNSLVELCHRIARMHSRGNRHDLAAEAREVARRVGWKPDIIRTAETPPGNP